MKRLFKWIAGTVAGLLLMAGLALAGWHVIDDSPAIAQLKEETSPFDADALFVLVDADMAATAYADAILHPIVDAKDLLVTLDNPGAQNPTIRKSPVPNTVMGWPGSMTASKDGSLLFIISARKAVDRAVQAFENRVQDDMPRARLLSVVDAESGEMITQAQTCDSPLSVDLAPSETWLLIACGSNETQLQVIPLEEGKPSKPRSFSLDVPDYELAAAEPGARFASVHPMGEAAGVILHNRYVTLVRFEVDEQGIPMAASAEAPMNSEGWLSMSRWTRSGGHFIVADVAWGPAPTDALFNGKGRLISYALSPENDTRGVASEAVVSKSPEGFEFNRTGDLIAVVNMERTALPGGPLGLAPGRNASSLSLVSVNDASGALETQGQPVGFRGVLPEDVAFDADGDQLAVVVFQDHEQPRSDGWIAYFDIVREGGALRVIPLDKTTPLPRGGHDLYVRY